MKGRDLIFHEVAHLLGIDDTYEDAATKEVPNLMNTLDKNNGKLTDKQIVNEAWASTIGTVLEVFRGLLNKNYKQPSNPAGKEDTKTQLKSFIEKNGSATKL